jgi:hypothetical protein
MSDDQSTTFIDLCLRGEVSINDVDDFVDAWHGGAGKATLREYLGMSEHEYSLWLTDPDELSRIFASRRIAAL